MLVAIPTAAWTSLRWRESASPSPSSAWWGASPQDIIAVRELPRLLKSEPKQDCTALDTPLKSTKATLQLAMRVSRICDFHPALRNFHVAKETAKHYYYFTLRKWHQTRLCLADFPLLFHAEKLVSCWRVFHVYVMRLFLNSCPWLYTLLLALGAGLADSHNSREHDKPDMTPAKH